MEQGVLIKRILRDMKLFGIIHEDDFDDAEFFMNAIYVAAQEHKIKELQAHHLSKVGKYSMDGKLLGVYNSISEAAREAGYHPVYGRNVIHNSLSGRYAHTKKRHIWKYINNEESY